MRLTVRATAIGTLTLKLAESLNVYGVVGEGLGRLLALRVRGQNSVLVNLPRTLVRGTTISLTIAYGGRLRGCVGGSRSGRRAAGRRRSTRSSPTPPSRASSTAIAATGIRRRRSPTTRPACCG